MFVKRYCLPCSEFLSLPFKHIPMHYHTLSVRCTCTCILYSDVVPTQSSTDNQQPALQNSSSPDDDTVQAPSDNSNVPKGPTEEIIRVFLNKNLQ